jgi:photosystem II S4 domain protein
MAGGRAKDRGKGGALPREELLAGCRRAAELGPLIDAAQEALRTWEPVRTGFLDAELREEAERRLAGLSELALSSSGGHPGAERRRLLLRRAELLTPAEVGAGKAGAIEDGDGIGADREGAAEEEGLGGLEISGNFLFDPAGTADFRQGLKEAGAAEEEIGDLWVRGDRGAQAIVTAELAARLDGGAGRVRSVEVRFEARPIQRLHLPAERVPRRLVTVEASLRLDAVASAGFGLSRQKMADRIREGAVRINWQPVSSPSRELAAGDRVRLEGRGELRVEAISATKRGRYRIELERS